MRKPQNVPNRPERKQACASKYHRRATRTDRIRYTEEAYDVIRQLKNNHEQRTGQRLSDSLALEHILLAVKNRVINDEPI